LKGELLTLRALRKAKVANRIDVARDGQQALDYLFCAGEFSDLPAVVVLDIGLPRLSGLGDLLAGHQRISAGGMSTMRIYKTSV